MDKNKKIVILGSGLSGLTAAWRLSEEGYDVEILESKSYPGGMSASLKRGEYIFDHGPHGYFTENDEFYEVFRKIMDDTKYVINNKDVRISFQGKYYRYPLRAIDLLSKLSPLLSMECFFSYFYTFLKNKIRPPKESNTEEWISSHFGRKLYQIYFGPYTKKVWGLDPKKLSPKFARLRIPKMNLLSVVIKSFVRYKSFIKTNGGQYEPIIHKFAYPKDGAGAFPLKLIERMKNNNIKLHLSSKIEKLALNNGYIRVSYRQQEIETEIKADIVISTIPINETLSLIGPGGNKEVLNAVSFFKYRSAVILCMVINKDRMFIPETLYFSDKFFTRVSDMKNYGVGCYPEGMTGLMCEITCDFNDEIWRADDKCLLEKATKDLEKENIITHDNVMDYFTIKLPHAYPIYTIGYDHHLEVVKKYLASMNNLFLTGRQAQFRYIDMHFAVLSGLKTAEFIISGRSKDKAYEMFNSEEDFY